MGQKKEDTSIVDCQISTGGAAGELVHLVDRPSSRALERWIYGARYAVQRNYGRVSANQVRR